MMLILNLSYRVKEHIKHICWQTAIIYLIKGIRYIVKVHFQYYCLAFYTFDYLILVSVIVKYISTFCIGTYYRTLAEQK